MSSGPEMGRLATQLLPSGGSEHFKVGEKISSGPQMGGLPA